MIGVAGAELTTSLRGVEIGASAGADVVATFGSLAVVTVSEGGGSLGAVSSCRTEKVVAVPAGTRSGTRLSTLFAGSSEAWADVSDGAEVASAAEAVSVVEGT